MSMSIDTNQSPASDASYSPTAGTNGQGLTRSMKVLCVIDSLGSGGAQRQMAMLARGLKSKGHEVVVFVYYPQFSHFQSQLDAIEIPIIRSKKNWRFATNSVRELKRLIASETFDICISFLDTPNVYNEIANLFSSRTLVVVSERSSNRGRRPSVFRWLTRQFHRFADHITVNSIHHRDDLLRQHPWLSNRITTIYNGVDLEEFRPRKAAAFENRFVAIGSIYSLKNVHGLIRAVRHVRDRGEWISVDWVGKVSDRKYYQEAVELIKHYQLEGSWNWRNESRNVSEVLQQYDALIHPATCEGLPNAVCEGLASGLPILAGNVGDLPQLISSHKNGCLFNPEHSQSIADAIWQFISCGQPLKVRMGQESRIIAEDKLDMSRFVADYDQLFRRLILSRTVRQ